MRCSSRSTSSPILLHRLGDLIEFTTDIKNAWVETVERITPPLVALLFAVATVQIMLQSGAATGRDSMLIVLSKAVAGVAGGTYPFFAAFVGAFGAFLAGSNTVSDILFGTFQYGVARDIGVSRTLLLAAQAVGGAIGNLIAIHNVVAALAVVGLVGEEGTSHSIRTHPAHLLRRLYRRTEPPVRLRPLPGGVLTKATKARVDFPHIESFWPFDNIRHESPLS